MKVLCIIAPEDGTTRGSGDATPGLILRDSLMTAVYESREVSMLKCHKKLAGKRVLPNTEAFPTRIGWEFHLKQAKQTIALLSTLHILLATSIYRKIHA
jgi:hypothetical protein